jgi:hypothetical protein
VFVVMKDDLHRSRRPPLATRNQTSDEINRFRVIIRFGYARSRIIRTLKEGTETVPQNGHGFRGKKSENSNYYHRIGRKRGKWRVRRGGGGIATVACRFFEMFCVRRRRGLRGGGRWGGGRCMLHLLCFDRWGIS